MSMGETTKNNIDENVFSWNALDVLSRFTDFTFLSPTHLETKTAERWKMTTRLRHNSMQVKVDEQATGHKFVSLLDAISSTKYNFAESANYRIRYQIGRRGSG